ncbi:MAG TPA: response regulator [Blastocatellia bacterium]|nr:response regulator [Blastocatellia bacterium]
MKKELAAEPINILLVDDDPADVELTVAGLKDTKLWLHIDTVHDGAQAIAFLSREGAYAEAPKPDLILLDLNMPKMNGRQVLAKIKEDPDNKRIPVVILTTSSADKDILDTYELGANCYVTKPVDLDQFTAVVTAIEQFWFTIVKLPDR